MDLAADQGPLLQEPIVDFRIADTFTDSLARLTAQEQKAAKTTAFDLQMDPSAPGLSFHKLDRAKDTNFWSVRVNADMRLIVHRTASSLLLAYVDHHDGAYKWAERRKIERHPTTGAMQLVEVRERVEDVPVFAPKPNAAPAAIVKPKLFDNLRKFELMAFGVPGEWVNDVRAADEDTLLDVIAHLPQEAQEALLKLAVGDKPEAPKPAPADADPFAHPDSQRRFRLLANAEDLQRALDFPWEKWAVFLHPAQAALVDTRLSRPRARLRFRRHRQDHRRAASRDASSARELRRRGAAHDIFQRARECAEGQACPSRRA